MTVLTTNVLSLRNQRTRRTQAAFPLVPPPPPPPAVTPLVDGTEPAVPFNVTFSGNAVHPVRDVAAYPGTPDRVTTPEQLPVAAIRFVDHRGLPVNATAGLPSSAFVGNTAPGTPQNGMLWWNADRGEMFVYYNDGNSSQWVPATPSSPGQTTTPTMFGAIGDGVTDDRVALQAAADSGAMVLLDRIYAVGGRISWTHNGGGFYGNGTGGLLMLTQAGKFDSTSTAGGYYGSNGVAILVDGFNNTVFENFSITLGGTPSPDNVCLGLALRNSSGHSVRDVEMSGFKKAKGMISVDNCVASEIVGCYLHDSLAAGSTNGQLTAISIDDNLSGTACSQGLQIRNNRIRNLTVDPVFLAANQYQTDAITIAKIGSQRHVIIGNTIENVGEGLDCFGNYCTVSNNTFYACFNYSLKFIHGGSYNIGRGNVSDHSGLAALIYSGSSTAVQDCAFNDIEVACTNCNPIVNAGDPWAGLVTLGTGAWDASGSSGAVRTINPGGSISFAKNNIARFTIANSSHAQNAMTPQALTGNNKFYYTTDYTPSVTTNGNAPADYFKNLNPSRVRAYMAAGSQVMTTGVTTIVLYDTEVFDSNNEFDTSTGTFTAKSHMVVSVTASVRASGGAVVGNIWTLTIGSTSANTVQSKRTIATAGENIISATSALMRLDRGDFVRVQFLHDLGSNLSINGGVNSTFTNIEIMEY